MTDRECSTCEHSRSIQTEDPAAGRLYCHRYARRASDKQWPIVMADDSCGDYNPNHKEQQAARIPAHARFHKDENGVRYWSWIE